MIRNAHTDVLLIYPPEDYPENGFHKDFQLNIGGVPLGILYIASHLRSNGIDVQLYDARIDFNFESINKHNRREPFRFGASDETIAQHIKRLKPKIVGVSSLFLNRINDAFHVCSLVKKIDRNIMVVIGGPSCSILSLDIFNMCNDVDAIVLGEGEEVFLELVRCCIDGRELANIDSIVYRKGSQILYSKLTPAYVKDIDSVSEPDYHLVELERYFQLSSMNLLARLTWCGDQMDRALSVTSSRGCPYKCIFCTRRLHNTNKWRAESPNRFVYRIRRLYEEFQITHFYIEDDAWNISKKRFEEILDLMIKLDANFTWSAPNGIRAEGLSDEIVRKCVKSGCISLQVGIESGDQKVLNKIVKKRLDLQKVKDGVKNCSKIGLDIGGFFMIGFPGESKVSIWRTLALALRLNFLYSCRIHLSIATPYQGSELRKLAMDSGCLRTVRRRWNVRNILLGAPKDNNFMEIIETSDFSFRFLSISQMLVNIVALATLVLRSLAYTSTKKVKWAMAIRSFSQSKRVGAKGKLKSLLFRYLIFPKMVKRL